VAGYLRTAIDDETDRRGSKEKGIGQPFSASSEGRREIEAIELGSFDCFGFPLRSGRFEGRLTVKLVLLGSV
jgi:hypothetical protein